MFDPSLVSTRLFRVLLVKSQLYIKFASRRPRIARLDPVGCTASKPGDRTPRPHIVSVVYSLKVLFDVLLRCEQTFVVILLYFSASVASLTDPRHLPTSASIVGHQKKKKIYTWMSIRM